LFSETLPAYSKALLGGVVLSLAYYFELGRFKPGEGPMLGFDV